MKVDLLNDGLFGQSHFQAVSLQFPLNNQNKYKNNFFCLWTSRTKKLLLFLSENGSSLNASKQNSFSLQTQHYLILEQHSELVEAELYTFHKKHED